MGTTTSKWSDTGNKPGNGPKIETKEDCYESRNHDKVEGNVCSNDKDNHLTLCKVENPSHGTVTWKPDDSFCYTPKDKNWCGEDKFCYTVKDKFGQEKTEWCKIVVKPDEKPQEKADAKDDCFYIDECATLCFDVLKNDCGDKLEIVEWTTPEEGKLELVNGQFKYTAEKDVDCIDETLCFTYKVKDCYGNDDTAKVTIKVNDTTPQYEIMT